MDSGTEDRKEKTQKSGPDDTLLMDTEPGGENTIYEGQQTRVAVMPSNRGQFGKCHQTVSKDSWYLGLAKPYSGRKSYFASTRETSDREEMLAEVTRFDEAISHGFGGETSGVLGKANQVEPLRKNDQSEIGGR
ncbi:unnamed protein product [Blumeria hordei]|uniref:Uncharacterized protein n=1 Tax=Blumeria hordei TaxID=2867405 RepID=A0A383URE5_BLUHO|nr:unnamed protein product [Blumeria hordei]